MFTVLRSKLEAAQQWRCQDLLRGEAKLEITCMSWGTHGGLQQLLDD